MSFKAKDLQFDNEQPAFLRRLRGELTSGDTARHEQPIARSKRLNQDDEDDAPTYVLEDTKESLTKEEYEALLAGKDFNNKPDATSENTDKPGANEEKPKSKDKISEVGVATKKRKAAKIVGHDDDNDAENVMKNSKKTEKQPVKKAKKKAKAIKLTFGEEEDA